MWKEISYFASSFLHLVRGNDVKHPRYICAGQGSWLCLENTFRSILPESFQWSTFTLLFLTNNMVLLYGNRVLLASQHAVRAASLDLGANMLLLHRNSNLSLRLPCSADLMFPASQKHADLSGMTI